MLQSNCETKLLAGKLLIQGNYYSKRRTMSKSFHFQGKGREEEAKDGCRTAEKRQKRDKQIINIKKIIRKKYEIRSIRGIIGIYLESITI